MGNLALKTSDGGSYSASDDELTQLRAGMRGRACVAGEAGYDEARTLWNAMFDRRPGLILRCAGAGDVMRAVNFAREHGLVLAVRGGAHNIAGNAVCESGLMIDLSPMKSVRVAPAAGKAWVEPGVTLGELDKETQAFGLAVPTGINSTTGIAGLTLGGGFGWITRKFGLTVDSLLAADVVTAEGKLVQASEREHPDLFWALRGGGGNFGVVTSYEFQLHPLGPEVLSGLLIHPLDDAADLLKAYRRIVSTAPDELTCWVVMRKAPPFPFLPTEWHGREVLVLALCYCGGASEGTRAVADLRSLGKPLADVVAPHPFTGWQAAFDPLLTPGARNYWKTHNFLELADGAIEALLAALRHLPGPECEVFIAHLGGAMSRVPLDATAYPMRRPHFVMNVHTRWRDKAQDDAAIKWARDLFAATASFAAGSAYINFMPADEGGRVEEAYGANYRRLAKVKERYDPHNLFRLNQNIRPA